MFVTFIKTVFYFGLVYNGFQTANRIFDIQKTFTLKSMLERIRKVRSIKNNLKPYIRGEIMPQTVVESLMSPDTSKGNKFI